MHHLNPHLHLTVSFDESQGGIYTFLKNNISSDSILFAQYISSRQTDGFLFRIISAYNFRILLKSINPSSPVFLHGLFSPYFLVVLLAAKVVNKSLSLNVFPHGMLYPSVLKSRKVLLKNIWLRIFSALLADTATFYCLSSEELRHVKAYLPSSRATLYKPVIKPIVPLSNFHVYQEFKLTCFDAKKFVILARYSPEKQILETIKSFNQVTNPNISLSIYGSSNLNYSYYLKCLDLVMSLNDPRISLCGFVSGTQLLEILRTAHCGIVYSEKENFSFSLIDFVGSSNLVITNTSVGASSYFSDKDLFIHPTHDSYRFLSQTIKYISLMPASEFIDRTKNAFSQYLRAFT
ncbi:glycosyltransferase [bacterium]|nr:glycosyltransferase [bacterium]